MRQRRIQASASAPDLAHAALWAPLAPSEQRRWHDFRADLGHGLRRSALAHLAALLAAVGSYPETQRRAWAIALCRAHWDQEHLTAFAYPLLEQVVVPELRRGYEAGEAGYARWLALAVNGDLSWTQAQRLFGRDLGARALLREALVADPGKCGPAAPCSSG
jgi:hypothetical protein